MPLQPLLKARELHSRSWPGRDVTASSELVRPPSSEWLLTLAAGFDTALKCVPPGQWKILIVDDHSRELLESVYKEFDVLQQNVTGKCGRPCYLARRL